jgi:hypothetical protein
MRALVARSGQPHIEGSPIPNRRWKKEYSMSARSSPKSMWMIWGRFMSRDGGCVRHGAHPELRDRSQPVLGRHCTADQLGLARTHHVRWTPRRIVNNNLAEYRVPTDADVGSIETLRVDEVDDHVSPIGVKGIGEIGITGSAARRCNRDLPCHRQASARSDPALGGAKMNRTRARPRLPGLSAGPAPRSVLYLQLPQLARVAAARISPHSPRFTGC